MSHCCRIRRDLTLALCAAAIAFSAPAAQPVDDAAKVARLSLEVQRAEDLRAVKRLQITYAQYVQFGLWGQAASLFAGNAEAIFGADRINGRAAIGKFFLNTWGNGREGLPAGGLHTLLEDTAGPQSLGGRSDGQGPMARIPADRTIWRQRALGTGHHREQLREGRRASGRFPASTTIWRPPAHTRRVGSLPVRQSISCRFTTRPRRRAGQSRRFRRACGYPRSRARPRPRSPRSTGGSRR